MLKFYYSGAPNPTKVALFLEETGAPYDPIPIDTRKGEQHKPGFLATIRAPSCFISPRKPANCSLPRPTKLHRLTKIGANS